MSTKVVIPIAELVAQTATRARGKEAFSSLVGSLARITERPVQVVIDLSNAEVVTGSFFDELVLRTSGLPDDVQITFRVASLRDLAKLEKVCAIRAVHCRYQVGESGDVRRTRRTSVPRIRAQEFPGAFFNA